MNPSPTNNQQQPQPISQLSPPKHNLFDPNRQQPQPPPPVHLGALNNLSIPSLPTNPNIYNPNIANMRNLNTLNTNPHPLSPPNNNNNNNQAAVLQDFSTRSANMINSPNSSSLSPRSKHQNIDYNALNMRLRDDHKKMLLFWSQTQQNDALYQRLDRPLIEALLLPKHRPQILDYERKIIEFLISDDKVYRFAPNMSSFNRLLLHRLSETFALDHHVEHVQSLPRQHSFNPQNDNRAVTIYKTMASKLLSVYPTHYTHTTDDAILRKVLKFHYDRLILPSSENFIWTD